MYSIYHIPDANHNYGFIKRIDIGEEKHYPLALLAGLNRINIFIGANNSGKSRFLRRMFQDTKRKSIIEIHDGLNQWIVNSEGDLPRDLRSFFMGTFNRRINQFDNNSIEFLDKYYIYNSALKSNHHETLKVVSDRLTQLLNVERKGKPITFFGGERIYVPVLRGLNPICVNDSRYEYDNDIYTKRIIKQYFLSKRNMPEVLPKEIFTGQSIYTELQNMLLGDSAERDKVNRFESFLSHNIFGDKSITLIPKINNSDTVTVKIGHEEEREIHNLGDGIQSLILLTFPVFMNSDKEMMFFFEEPEINMHPGMQRVFLKALQNAGFEKHQYFLTTHSNHFVDTIFDYSNISLYMFEKVNYTDVENVKIGYSIERVEAGNVDVLKHLGVNNSSIFLSNCTIWVEGITDKLIMKEYINRQLKKENLEGKYIEDLHYSFIEYGGSSISHLTCNTDNIKPDEINIKGICNKPLIVADFDRDNKHVSRRKKLGDCYFYVKEAKEMENTLSEEILWRVIADYEGLPDYKQLELKDSTFSFANYKDIPLGKYIDTQLGRKKKRRGSYESGITVSDKIGFAKRAGKFLSDESISYEDAMSPAAIKLANKLVGFIKESNIDISSI